MYAIFENLEQYNAKNLEINNLRGYPNDKGTLNYASENPQQTIDGKYAMRIMAGLEEQFAECEQVETVKFLTWFLIYNYRTKKILLCGYLTIDEIPNYDKLYFTLREFETETEMNDYIEDNNLITEEV